jgi:hypothetical protein
MNPPFTKASARPNPAPSNILTASPRTFVFFPANDLPNRASINALDYFGMADRKPANAPNHSPILLATVSPVTFALGRAPTNFPNSRLLPPHARRPTNPYLPHHPMTNPYPPPCPSPTQPAPTLTVPLSPPTDRPAITPTTKRTINPYAPHHPTRNPYRPCPIPRSPSDPLTHPPIRPPHPVALLLRPTPSTPRIRNPYA